VGIIPPGTKLAGWAVAGYQGEAIRKVLGTPGWVWVHLIGFWVLFGTQLGVTDAASRQMADMLYNLFPGVRKWAGGDIRRIYYLVFAFVVIWVILLVSVVKLPLTYILISANIAGFVFVYGGIQTLVVNNKFLPKAIRPNWFENLMIVCLIVFYGIFSLFAMNKAFGPTGMALLLAFYILILILGLVDFAKRKEEGFQE
jgi:predicted neutral ceramidase superfamily lipid hydrolase